MNANETKHTPGPWEIFHGITIYSPEADAKIATVEYAGARSRDEADANGDFIVRACNAHDAMLAALEAIGQIVERTPAPTFGDFYKQTLFAAIQIATDALALARGEEEQS